jgi:hypothetical protein
MINFFRKIRQKLLSKNQINKYLLYAFGEILLVVIGILIALQINNWSEENKMNDSISHHLKILELNLKEDQIQLEGLKRNMTVNVYSADSAMLQIKTIIPVNKHIKRYLVQLLLEYQFSPNTNAMETITQSNEIPALKSELRTAILDYYALIEKTKEREHISNTQIYTKYENHFVNEYREVFQKDNEWDFIKAFYKNDPRPTSPIDKNKLLTDNRLEVLLVSRYFQSTELKNFYEELLISAEDILELLAEEIED